MKREDLLSALETVKPGLANKEVVEQATSFAFAGGRVVTYNDVISISHPVKDLDVEGAVSAEELYQLLRRIKQDEITAKIEKDEIILESGWVKAGLRLQSEILLPLEEITKRKKWHTIPENLLKSIKFAMNSCSRESSKPIITCVHVNKDGFVEGSDGYRIVHCKLKSEMPVDTFLIPNSSAQEVVKVQPVEIAETPGWIHFRTAENTVLSCRVFKEVYPETAQFLKVKGTKITFPRTIEEVIDRAAVFAKREERLFEEIIITLNKSRLQINSQSEVGWFKEEVRIRYDGEEISFTIIPYLLKDILSETLNCVYSGKQLKFEGKDWIYTTLLKTSTK